MPLGNGGVTSNGVSPSVSTAGTPGPIKSPGRSCSPRRNAYVGEGRPKSHSARIAGEGTIRRRKFTQDAAELLRLVDEREVGGLVIGLPINMNGTEGPRCQSSRQFAANLLALREIPIAFWDERLSTSAVERAMVSADLSRKKRAKRVDTAAAAYILQGALDSLAHARRT